MIDLTAVDEALNIAVKEHKYDFMCNIAAEIVTSLENQGFTFEELLDGLANYAYMTNKGADATCYIVQASLSARKMKN